MKVERWVIVLSAILGLCTWVLDTLVDVYFSERPFFSLLFLDVAPQLLLARVAALVVILAFGFFVSRAIARYRQAEQARRESGERFRQIVQQMPDPICVCAPDGTVELVNAAFIRTFSPEPTIGSMNVLQSPWLEELGLQKEVERAYRGEVVFVPNFSLSFERARPLLNLNPNMKREGGALLDVTMFPVQRQSGELRHVVMIWADITERRLVERELRWRADALATLHETALDLATQRALPDLLQAILRRASDLLQANGGSIYLYRPAEDNLQLALQHNLTVPLGIVLRRGEGLAGHVLETGQPINVGDYSNWEGRSPQYSRATFAACAGVPIHWGQRLLGVLVLVDDAPRTFSSADVALLERIAPLAAAALENARLYSDLQQEMEKLKAAQARLVYSARLAAIGELAAGIAHELNNPLTSILGFAELLVEDMPPDSPSWHDLQTIANEAQRARDIIRRLLNFARQDQPRKEALSLNRVLQETLALNRMHLEKSGVTVVEAYEERIPPVEADEGQLKQVFLNLINNAAQAMPDGGTLRVATALVNGEVMAAVTDQGVGITPRVRERLFEPFFTTKKDGTGLGLSVSLGIVQGHAGRITVESQPGLGSTFTVWLPLTASAAQVLDVPVGDTDQGERDGSQ